MTAAEYRTAIATLGLSQLAAGRWLGVSNKTAQRYATTGPSGAAARAVEMAATLMGLKPIAVSYDKWPAYDPLVRVSDVSAALDLPAK